jgi:hypothetical protein
MASKSVVLKMLAMFGAVWPRDVTPAFVDVWMGVTTDLSDDVIEAAAVRCLAECRFFPVPAELRSRMPKPEPVDAGLLLQQIQACGTAHPQAGWIDPSVRTVRERFGEVVAAAYALAGGSRCFTGNNTGREIAARVFGEELEQLLTERPAERWRLLAPNTSAPKRLEPPSEPVHDVHPDVAPLIADVVRGLGS